MVDATVTLYKDIGLDANYARSMDFTSKSEQNTWFNSIASNLKTTLTNVNYNKVQNALYIHEQFGDVLSYTYARLQDIDDSGRTYYFFITNVTLVDDETTRFDLAMDPIQTFMAEWELGPCYVYKEHCDRWGSGSSPIRIIPGTDGINANMNTDICQELVVPSNVQNVEFVYGIIVFTSTRSFYILGSTAEAGDIRDNAMYYAIIPMYRDADKADDILYFRFTYGVNTPSGEVNFRLPTFNEFANGVAPALLGIDPNSVVGAYILPTIGCPVNVYNYNDSYAITLFESSSNLYQGYIIRSGGEEYYPKYPVCAWNATANILPTDGNVGCQILRYEDVFSLMDINGANITLTNVSKPTKPTDDAVASDTYEPALYMYPYTIRSFINNGALVGNIPDVTLFADDTETVEIFTNVKANGVQSYIYYGNPDTRVDKNTNIANGNCFLINNNPSDVIGDNYLSYCLTARDSDRRMMWSSIASNTINQAVFMGYGGALVGSRSNSGKNDPMKNANAVDVPNYGGAMARAMGFGLGSSFITSAITGMDMWIQQEAKEQTIRNTPPDTVALGSGGGIIDSGEFGYYYVERKCDDVNWNTAYDKFRHYGYTVNSMETPNIRSRKYYNYICTGNTVIKGALPANIKQALVNIFENGITLFHADYCDDTNYPTNSTGEELENIERSLL